MGDNKEFEKCLSTFDEIRWKYNPVGFYYVKSMRELRINRGYDIHMLKKFFPKYKFVVDNDAYEYKKADIKLKTGPRDDFQKVALTFMAGEGRYKANKNYTQILIDLQTGAGKAQPNDTKIPTPDGWRKLKDIEVGDFVFNKHGEPVKVLGVFPQKGLQRTYEVTFSDGRSTRCNGEHLWEVYRDHDTHPIVCTLNEIMETNNIYTIKLSDPVLYELIDVLDESYNINTSDGIPDVYKYNSIEVRRNLIRSIGSEYTTASKQLMKDIVEILWSLGCIPTISVDINSGMGEQYTISIPNESQNHIMIVDIKEVEPTYQRCILIDDPDHMYLTEDYIPTHNTYCGTAMSCYNNARVSIFVPFTKLLEQWKDSFLNFTDVDPDDIMIVQGSDACMKILKGKKKHIKVFLFMIDTISSFEAQYGPIKTMEMLEATQSYMKIIDEVHLDIKAIAMIEALSNFRMNFYLSASPGRTASKENWIFKTLFYNVPKFGSKDMMQSEKYLNIIIKQYKFIPDPIQMKSIINPRKKWLNTKAYETALFNASDQQRASFEQALFQMLNWIKKQIKPEFKVILFCNTIEGTEYLKNVAERVFPGECSRYYGTMGSKKEKEDALKQRVICATSSSLGTGADIKGLQFCINTCTYSSKIEAIQVSGRLRKLPNDPVAYIELVNVGWYKTMKQFEKRKPTLISRSRTNKLLIIE